jgi:glycerophosphoryl diester phosphodiesterase
LKGFVSCLSGFLREYYSDHFHQNVDIIAHRGSSYDAPENTLAATRLAWAEGADAVEVDIRLTADLQLAVIHDEDTRRVAGAAHSVGASTLAELKRLDVGRWKSAQYAGEKIPALDEVISSLPPEKRLFIEIKNGPEVVVELQRCLTRHSLGSKQVVVISFNFEVVAQAKKTLPHCAALWILDRETYSRERTLDHVIAQCHDAGLDGLDLAHDCPIDAPVVKRLHDAGLQLYVWTVDDLATARRLGAAGVNGITTNRPGWLRAQLASR